MSAASIEALFGRLLDDDLSEAELDSLLTVIQGDETARDDLLNQLRTAELLVQAYDDVRGQERFLAALESRIREADATFVSNEDDLEAVLGESRWRRGLESVYQILSNYMALSALISGLFITTILLSLALWTVPSWRPAMVNEAPAPTVVARLADTHEAVWASAEFKPRRGEHLLTGDRLELAAGFAEVAFDNGATVTLHGPASLRIHDSWLVALDHGQLVARVEPTGRGFAVETTFATFVDLGTEFGIEVLESKQVEAHVFEGVVEARTRGDGAAKYELRTGEALRVEGLGSVVHRLPARDRGFVRQLPRWESIPIANFSFEEPQLASEGAWQEGVAAWQGTANGGVSRFGRDFSQPVPHGEQMAFLNSGSLLQPLTAKLQPDTQYRLSVWIGNRPGANSPNYTVELYAGEALLAAKSNDPQPGKGTFGEVVLEFICQPEHPAIGEPLMIKMLSNGSLATQTQNHFDAVQLLARPHIAVSVAEN